MIRGCGHLEIDLGDDDHSKRRQSRKDMITNKFTNFHGKMNTDGIRADRTQVSNQFIELIKELL